MNNQEKTSFWKKMAVIGPAAILVSSSMGPGTIASCIMGGSHLGYKILWMVAASKSWVIIPIPWFLTSSSLLHLS